MASTSAAEIKATWHKGDTCLAPHPRDGILREATIKKLISASNSDDSTAMVVFTDLNKEDEEEEEEAIPVSKLLIPGRSFNTQEKPLFPSSLTHPGICVPLELSMTGVGGEKVPYTINRYLRDYQREGIRFIYSNYMHSRGSVLGDDMGLGKTVQVIGFLAAVLHKTGTWEDIENNRPQFVMSQIRSKQTKPNKVFLIVAPLSVLYNWKDELDTWGHFQCVVVHGLRKEEELARIRKGRVEIALTTYETLRLCLDQFNSVDWSAVIVDEAHKIKNPNSQITQAMKDLKCQVRIGLTGTILQNNLEELWCVMDWAIPGCLGSLGHFKSRFSDPIEKGQRYSATKRALATGRKTVRALVRKISRWFLRRTKTLITDQLPKKNDRVVYCSLTDFQQTVYQTVLDSEDVKLLLRSSEKCDCGRGRSRRSCCYQTNPEGVEMKRLYFSYLAILRKVSNHVALLQSTACTSKNQEKYVKVICERVFQKFPDFVQRCKEEAFEAMSDPMYSGKMKVLQKLLNYYMQRKDKVLLFSLSTKLLDVLENYCMAEGLDYSRLDGATKSKERVKIVKDFNSCPHTNLCLVSTMAGGLGLNFVGANVVVLFDPTWNPANDLQAIDRAYRIGQYRDVTVLRLISLGTVEEIIYLRQVYKQQLQCSVVGKESARRYFEAVQGSDGHKGELFGIKNLFRLQTKGTCLTRKILEREGQVEAGLMTTSTHIGEEKEEERKRVSEGGETSTTKAPKLNDDTAKENRNASEISRGVLDFSSGSEDDEEGQGARKRASDPSAVNGTGDGNTSTASGRMSLLQHGFSRLLQQVGMKPGSGDGDSSQSEADSVDGSISEEDKEDLGNTGKREGMPSGINKSSGTPGNGTAHDSNSRTNNLDIPSSSEQEGAQGKQDRGYLEKSDDTWRERPGQKELIKRKTIVNEESDENSESDIVKPNKAKTTVPRVHQFESYSDESEDLDIEAMTRPMMDGLNSRGRGGNRGRERSSSNRKRKSTATTRNQARTKYTENIETFTSSEEEHTPVKRESRGCHFTSPRTEGFRHNVPGQLKEGRPGIAVTTDRAGAERKPERPSAVSFTALKTDQATPITKGVDATIDSVLGGVKEVAYTHSNQHVVGGSKAEERMTRAAVRDVFQRKMYSQIPANLLVGTQEDLSQSPPNSPPYPAAVGLQRHPVTFTTKTVHHTRNTSFIIGETPRAVCRQQLEEMAAKFGSSSVSQFAEEVLRSSSAQRLTWLRHYYTSLNHPDLTSIITNSFPQPDSAQPESTTHLPSPLTGTSSLSSPSSKRIPLRAAAGPHSEARILPNNAPQPHRKPRYTQKNAPEHQKKPRTPQNNVAGPQKKHRIPQSNVPEPQKKPRIPQKNVLEPLSDVPSPESEEQEESVCNARGHNRTKRASVSSSGALKAGGGLGSHQASSSGLGPGEAAAFLDHRDRDTPSSPDLSHGWSTAPSKPTVQRREREPKSSSSEPVTEQGENPQAPSLPKKAPSTSSHHSLFTELIGDTSILDDLLRPKPRATQQSGSPKTPRSFVSSGPPTVSTCRIGFTTISGAAKKTQSLSLRSSHTPPTHLVTSPPQTSKGSRKDFWDILNEGNEESINRLTDLSEVERVCLNTNFKATKSGKEGRGSIGLWKANEKFLWKK